MEIARKTGIPLGGPWCAVRVVVSVRNDADDETQQATKASKGLAGGDILNVCLNAMYAGSIAEDPNDWEITFEILAGEIAKAKEAKRQHASRPVKSAQREIGFAAAMNEPELEQ